MTQAYMAKRTILVYDEQEADPIEYLVAVSAPYSLASAPEDQAVVLCKVYFGPADTPLDLEVPGADEIEALENATWYADVFIRSVMETSRVTTTDGRDLVEAFPSAITKRYRGSVGLLKGDSTS